MQSPNAKNEYDYTSDEKQTSSSAEAKYEAGYREASTPDNSNVDAFEYEPMGYMSKGRW